jgi:glucose/arabinose dehydrogenase
MRRCVTAVLAAVFSMVAFVSGAMATSGAPSSTNGQPVQLVASGLLSPTSFAFGDGAVFEGDSGGSGKVPNGGIYLLSGGKATKVKTKLVFVGGLQFRGSTLYVSGATLAGKGPVFQILAFKGWNGTTFTSQKAIYTAPKGFDGFNGLAFGANGRLYVGVDVGLTDNNDNGPASTSPYLYDILTMSATGGQVSVFASGIRQPWQMAFPKGSNSPFVSDFGQDKGAKNPPDFVLRVKAGDNYGFPKCDWLKTSPCSSYTKPFKEFPAHSDVGGVVIAGGKLYLSEFGFAAPLRPAEVVSLPLSGTGTAKPVVDDLPKGDSIVALGTDGTYLYFGVNPSKGAASVYRVKA